MIDKNLGWSDYREHGALNGSTLALLLGPEGSPKQLRYRVDTGIGPDPDVTRVGTGVHSLIQCLPMNRFSEFYVVMPNYKLDPNNQTTAGKPTTNATSWSREREEEFRAANDKEVLKKSEYERMTRMLKAVSENKEAMDIIIASDREVSVVESLGGIDCKGRIDGLCGGLQWNLKCCGGGITKRAFSRVESKLHYVFKDAMHRMLLEAAGQRVKEFKYLLVNDDKPIEKGPYAGKYRKPAECIVVDVPIEILQGMEESVLGAIGLYRQCVDTGIWPGIEPYTYVPYSPEEVILVD